MLGPPPARKLQANFLTSHLQSGDEVMNIFLRSFSLAFFSSGEPRYQDPGWTDGGLGKRRRPDLKRHPSQHHGLQAGRRKRLFSAVVFDYFETGITWEAFCIRFLRLR